MGLRSVASRGTAGACCCTPATGLAAPVKKITKIHRHAAIRRPTGRRRLTSTILAKIRPIRFDVPQKRSVLRPAATALVLVLALARSGQSAAQSAPPCTTPECVSRDRLWTPAARVHEIKNQFVAAVRQF